MILFYFFTPLRGGENIGLLNRRNSLTVDVIKKCYKF